MALCLMFTHMKTQLNKFSMKNVAREVNVDFSQFKQEESSKSKQKNVY